MTKFERCEQEERQTETLAQEAARHLQAQREQARRPAISIHQKVGQIPAPTKPQRPPPPGDKRLLLPKPRPEPLKRLQQGPECHSGASLDSEVPPPEGPGISREDV